ncbi:MAG: helix-turn-helix transcriptional regulator [Thermoanaerobaculia bacterium]
MPRADRLVALLRLLNGHRRWSMEALARELHTSQRSIYRDLADLEERGFAIEREEGTYRLVTQMAVQSLPLTKDERLLLTLLVTNPDVSGQLHFRKTLEALRTKLIATHGAAGAPAAALLGPDRSGAVPGAIVNEITDAVADRRSISILYTSLTGGSKTWRGIDPWAMIHRCDAWYLVGRCHVHDEPRTFRLDRIKGVVPIGATFAMPESFDAELWYAHSWGVAASGEPRDVVIHFDDSVSALIENARYHPSESKRRLDDGRIEYRVRIGNLDELARWIAGFGGAAQAIEPPELLALVRDLAGATLETHTPQPRRAAALRRGAKRVTH